MESSLCEFRILAYYSYLSEQILDPKLENPLIAPGCRSTTSADGRCTFNEFVQYLWYPEEGQSERDRPTVTVLGEGQIFEQVKIDTLLSQINAWQDKATKTGITGRLDFERLIPGSATFYDAIAKIGGPLGQLAGLSLKGMPQKEARRVTRIVTNGQFCASYAYRLRFTRFESFRIPKLVQALGIEKGDLIMKAGDPKLGGWKYLDAPETIKNIQVKLGGLEQAKTKFFKAMDELKTVDDSAKEHLFALEAVDSAQRGAGCKPIMPK